jgi:hypothetical protein
MRLNKHGGKNTVNHFFVLFVAPVSIYFLVVVFAHWGVIVENFSAKKKKKWMSMI